MGRVCSRHDEWCPQDVCRWCEPAPAPKPIAQKQPVTIGGYYDGYDLLPVGHRATSVAPGGVPSVTCRSGLILPALKAVPRDPTIRKALEAAWDAAAATKASGSK